MGIKFIKKTGEARANLKTFKKDLVYVPGFKNTKVLHELIDDIHAMYQYGEEGWEGDAVSFSSYPRVLESSDYPYLLVVGGDFAESMFAFQSKSDRDAIVIDYLPDSSMM
jgi:hypothetical protein